MSTASPKVYETTIPSKEYFQVCFPGSVNPSSGGKVLQMIGGPGEVERTIRDCIADGKSSIKLQLGPSVTGPILHGTTTPTNALWLKLKMRKQKKGSPKRYVSNVSVQGVIRASAVFNDPADLCFFPVENTSAFDPSMIFEDADAGMSKFNPLLRAKGINERPAPDAVAEHSLQRLNIRSTRDSTRKPEMYLPPPLFFPETKDPIVSWFHHMTKKSHVDDSGGSNRPSNVYEKMRFFEFNAQSNSLSIRPKSSRDQHVDSSKILECCLSLQETPFVRERKKKRKAGKFHPQKSRVPCLTLNKYCIFDQETRDGALVIPTCPPTGTNQSAIPSTTKQRTNRWMEVLQYLFKIRPIWSMQSLLSTIQGIAEAENVFRYSVGCIAYRVVGPTVYSKLWVRLGYSPFELSMKKNGSDEMKEAALLQKIVFSMPRESRRAIRRRFPSFGHRQKYLPSGFRRTSSSADESKIRSIIKPKQAEKPTFFMESFESISCESIANIDKCRQSVEEFFDDMLLTGSVVKSFYPADLRCERIRTVITSQIPAQVDKLDGLILTHTRRAVQSILIDELGSYMKEKFPAPTRDLSGDTSSIICDDQACLEHDGSDTSDSDEYDVHSSDSCFDFSDDEDTPI